MNSKLCDPFAHHKNSWTDSEFLSTINPAEGILHLPPIPPTRIHLEHQYLFELIKEQKEKIDSLEKIISSSAR
jgi:hypothetical protein